MKVKNIWDLAIGFRPIKPQAFWGLWGNIPKIPDAVKHLCPNCSGDIDRCMSDMHDDGIDYQCPCGHDWTEYYNVVPEDYDGV